MIRKALLIVAPGFEEIEAITPIDLLRRAGIHVTVAGLGSRQITGGHEISLSCDTILSNNDREYDALILPGGTMGAKNLAQSDLVATLIRYFSDAGKIVAAICASPAIVLLPTGILQGKKATCFPTLAQRFGKETHYMQQPVVVDDNIITSQGPGTAFEFGLALIGRLVGKQVCQDLRKATLLS